MGKELPQEGRGITQLCLGSLDAVLAMFCSCLGILKSPRDDLIAVGRKEVVIHDLPVMGDIGPSGFLAKSLEDIAVMIGENADRLGKCVGGVYKFPKDACVGIYLLLAPLEFKEVIPVEAFFYLPVEADDDMGGRPNGNPFLCHMDNVGIDTVVIFECFPAHGKKWLASKVW